MRKLKEDHFYLLGLILLTAIEFVLAIPMVIPLFDIKMSEIYLVTTILHLLGIALLFTKMVEIRPYSFHIYGAAGFFFSVIPYVNFIFHGVICFVGIRAIRRGVQQLKQQVQPTEEREDLW